ncbi:MAG: Amino-acid carrier protein AlsT [Chlamydiae bacterium]|nr:Amino-acid carrier protein AlsT [Chlamydiota bacterium]
MEWLNTIYHYVWGIPMLLLLIGNGLFLTISLRGLQFRYLPYALKLVFFPDKERDKKAQGDISNFESLMTALAGSIGIGNIAGVSTALAVGGLGALFWMWVMALIGMATKYAEAILAVKYRITDDRGEMCGGPMHFIEQGLGWKWLASSFALFGAVAAFGGGNMIQANSVADVMDRMFHVDPLWTGIVLAVVTGSILLGGIKSIGKVAAYLVPFMAIFYICGGCVILFKCYERVPAAFVSIIKLAFTGQAAFGGFAGSTMLITLQVGLSRGLMTSEAGLGTASIAAAAAKTDTPGRQAMVSMTGSFIATVILCSVTGLVLAVTDVFGAVGSDGKLLNGASMTMTAFQSVIPWGGYIVTIGLVLFALTTLLGWAYYGEKCLEYLCGTKAIPIYRGLFILVIIPGAVLDLELVWKISDITNGLMAYPNLIGITALSSVVVAETRDFLSIVKEERVVEAGV